MGSTAKASGRIDQRRKKLRAAVPCSLARKYTWNRAVLKGMAPAIKLMIAGAVVGVLRNRLASLFGTATAPGLGL